jgi:hypothetical protein
MCHSVLGLPALRLQLLEEDALYGCTFEEAHITVVVRACFSAH